MVPEHEILAGLQRRGIPAHIAAGIVTGMRAESGLNPGINEINPVVPGSRGGYGLNQWTGPRRVAYEGFARERGVPLDDLETQLDFTVAELHGPESAAWRALQGATTPEEAARIYETRFLRPGIPHGGRGGRPSGLLNERASTMNGPVPPEEPNVGPLGGLLGLKRDTSRLNDVGLMLMMLSNPRIAPGVAQMVQGRRKEREERQEERETQERANRTIAMLQGQPGGEQYAQYAEATGDAAGAYKLFIQARQERERAAADGVDVQSSQLLHDGTTVFAMRDGSVRVVSPTGETLTGDAATEAIAAAREAEAEFGRELYGSRRAGTLGADIDLGAEAAAQAQEGKMRPELAVKFMEDASLVQSNLTNIADAIRAIDEGAQSGIVYNMLPNITVSSATLQNAMNRMGLDVVGSVTFGALSEGEMRLALETAVPQSLGPEELREWLVRKQEAQTKALEALRNASLHFARGGTLADYAASKTAAPTSAGDNNDPLGLR